MALITPDILHDYLNIWFIVCLLHLGCKLYEVKHIVFQDGIPIYFISMVSSVHFLTELLHYLEGKERFYGARLSIHIIKNSKFHFRPPSLFRRHLCYKGFFFYPNSEFILRKSLLCSLGGWQYSVFHPHSKGGQNVIFSCFQAGRKQIIQIEPIRFFCLGLWMMRK